MNHHPPQFHQLILRRKLDEIPNGKTKTRQSEISSEENGRILPLVLRYRRGHKSERTAELSTFFSTRKLETAVPPLKSPTKDVSE